jgi:hypothetical protein
VEDPQKRAEALQIQKAFKAKVPTEKVAPSKLGEVTEAAVPDYGQTWFNLTGGEMLGLRQMDLWPESIMTVHTKPANSFPMGTQSLTWSWLLSGWDQGPMDGRVVWNAPNNSWFGVNVHVPAQLAGIGYAPYYEVVWSEPGKNTWHSPVSDPATPWSFPTSLGYQIDIRTQCGHASIAVSITVARLKK